MQIKIIIGLLLLCLTTGLGIKYLKGELDDARKEIVGLQEANVVLVTKLNEIAVKSQNLDQALQSRTLELRKRDLYLKSMAGREATLVAKPELVQKLIQKAVKEREARLECLTGGLCEHL